MTIRKIVIGPEILLAALFKRFSESVPDQIFRHCRGFEARYELLLELWFG